MFCRGYSLHLGQDSEARFGQDSEARFDQDFES